MIRLAHLSDLHLDGTMRNAERADRVMRYLNELPGSIDAVIITGDIVDTGAAAEYEQARYILESDHQVVVCPGNTDDRANFRSVLLREGGEGPVNQVIKAGGAVIAMLDSSVPGEDHGFLADETLVWLEDLLASQAPEVPVFIGFHHPPADLGIALGTTMRGTRRLAEIIERYPNVVALLAGHAHTGATTTFAGRPLLVAPGVANTAPLPWDGFGFDYAAAPAIAFHVLDDEGTLTTHFRVVGE